MISKIFIKKVIRKLINDLIIKLNIILIIIKNLYNIINIFNELFILKKSNKENFLKI